MSQLDHDVQERASDVLRAVVAANTCGDAAQCAFDVCCASVLVAGDDQAVKTALAMLMLRLAKQLDGDIVNATLQ